jgi:hypothetical protein
VDVELWNSRWTVFVETESSRWLFISAAVDLCCAALVVWLLETALLNVRWSLSVNVDFHPLFLFADIVFPWFVYGDIILEIVALDIPYIMWQFLSQMCVCVQWHLGILNSQQSEETYSIGHFQKLNYKFNLAVNTSSCETWYYVLIRRFSTFFCSWPTSEFHSLLCPSNFLYL